MYDLTKDRQIRARARFENLSLGQAIKEYQFKPCIGIVHEFSYCANEGLELIENNELTDLESEILSKIENHRDNNNLDLLDINPALHHVIKSYVLLGLNSELAKAKRARHIGNVIKHVEAMSYEPRYKVIDLGLLDTVPY